MTMTIVVFAWYLSWLLHSHTPSAFKGLAGVSAYFILVSLHLALVHRYPGNYPVRRLAMLIVDHVTCILLMFQTGALGAFLVFSNPWITVGNGIRFGEKWMKLSAGFADAGLICLGLFPGYWHQQLILIASLLLLNTAIPAYVAILLRGLEESRAKLADYADQMGKMALRDSLTGLPNRSALFEELDRLSSHAHRHHLAIALLYFDLDGFKKVNDSYGHTVGDMLLKETAIRVRAVLRDEDVLARLGGDEFVAVLQLQDSVDHPQVVADRILQAMLSIRLLDGCLINVSASVGGIVVSGDAAIRMGAEQLVHEADRNMYKAKKGGKNRIVLTELSNNALHAASLVAV
ncbi:MAG: GGDEF domain-containing protein [Thiobacillaceae bacterium]